MLANVFFICCFITAIVLHFFRKDDSGFLILGVLLIASWFYNYRIHQKIQRWAQHPLHKPPTHLGHYEDCITSIYHFLHYQEKTFTSTSTLNQQILGAANAFPVAIVILDTQYMIRWCNQGALTLLNIDNAKDRGYNLFNYMRSPEFYAYVHNTDWSTPYLFTQRQNEQTLHLKIELHHYSYDNILLLCFDNTQLEKLRTTQQDFIANVSHELRTPLTVLMGFLETLNELPTEAISPEQRKHFEQLMQEQAHRMLAIVSDLLTLSTLESTKLSDEDSVVLADIIEQAKAQTLALSNHQHHITWDIHPHLSVKGNAHELRSAITNLLTNAVRYTPTGGEINVFWGQNEQGNAVFSVKDTGLGIASSDLHRITERFYRVDKSRSRASGGTGLGLAITKHIAIRHHAKLQIESKLHKGSTFSLIFPQH